MKYSYDEKLKCMVCEPDSAEEWMEAIWEYGSDYDGENTVEGLKSLIDELIDCSNKARKCLRDGKILFDKAKDSASRAEAVKQREKFIRDKVGYCPLCDKMIEKKTDQDHIHCPYCGHRIGLREENLKKS